MKHNPWIGVLWPLGAAFIVTAVVGRILTDWYYFRASTTQSVTQAEQFLTQLNDVLSMPMLLLGFATFAGLLFLHARSHARRVAGRR